MFLQMGIKPHEAVLLAKLLRRQAPRRRFLKIKSPSGICLATVALLSSSASESMVIRTDFLIKGPFVCYSKKSVLGFSKADQPTQSWNETQPQRSGKRRGVRREEGGGGGPCPSPRSSGGAHRGSWKHSPVSPASASAAPRRPSKGPPPDRLGAAPGKQGWLGRAQHGRQGLHEERATKAPGGELIQTGCPSVSP